MPNRIANLHEHELSQSTAPLAGVLAPNGGWQRSTGKEEQGQRVDTHGSTAAAHAAPPIVVCLPCALLMGPLSLPLRARHQHSMEHRVVQRRQTLRQPRWLCMLICQ